MTASWTSLRQLSKPKLARGPRSWLGSRPFNRVSQASRRPSPTSHLRAVQLGEQQPVRQGVEDRLLPHEVLGRLPDARRQAAQVLGVPQRLERLRRVALPAHAERP